MKEEVYFFPKRVQCIYCLNWTYGIVQQYSGKISCEHCLKIIFDGSDAEGTVVILDVSEHIGSIH